MKQSITQELVYGCGVACYAFALNISYRQAVKKLGDKQANSNRFWIKDFVAALDSEGAVYISKYVKPHIQKLIYQEGVIVLIRRSKHYPSGHYLIRHSDMWMDPWINLPFSKDINQAKSGFRKRLPGKAMYALLPKTSGNILLPAKS